MYIVYNGAQQGSRASVRFIQNFALSEFVLMRFHCIILINGDSCQAFFNVRLLIIYMYL